MGGGVPSQILNGAVQPGSHGVRKTVVILSGAGFRVGIGKLKEDMDWYKLADI